ncbi:MAG: phosphatidate cytidylyltransferase [Polyangiales bacterium]
MSNLAARVIVGLIFAPAILVLLYVVNPLGFFLLALVASVIASSELFAMTSPQDRIGQIFGGALTATVNASLYFAHGDARILTTLLVAVPLLGVLFPLLRLGDLKTAALRSATFAFAPFYCGAPLAFLSILRRDVHPGFVVLALMIAWFGDTGGYFAGRFLGNRKLYQAVSPKKTIEGAIGGLGGSVLGALSASLFYLHGRLPVSHAIPLAIVGGVLGQGGDLAESLLKRSTGVKDSGGLLPGHGGILDRIDALLFTASTVYLYTLWI